MLGYESPTIEPLGGGEAQPDVTLAFAWYAVVIVAAVAVFMAYALHVQWVEIAVP